MMTRKSNLVPILFLVMGFLFVIKEGRSQENVVQEQAIKYGRLLRLIESFYVDTVNIEAFTEDIIVKGLAELDPHSVYINKEEVEKMNEPLQGSFEGIGISFSIYLDTLMVTATIPGGPSEKVGLRAGDRIMKVGEKEIAGIGLQNSDVFELLRGKKGTKVDLSIARANEPDLLDFTIIRDKIPIYSMDAAYMLNNETGYIKLNRFAAKTVEEFEEALKNLNQEKTVKNLVLDLRSNGGGYLRAAIGLADNFLSQEKMIVYTEGTHNPRRDYRSTSSGDFEKGNLVVLIDESSASASEIVAGAVQDWDRGIIIGRRSYGKGLVQQPYMLTDGSMVRLTTAHYYTPAGRNIQKPFKDDIEAYRNDYFERLERGELFSADSVNIDKSLTFETLESKRTVYGGGGIMPDLFVPVDTSRHYSYVNTLIRKNILYPYVLGYLDANRDKIQKKYKTIEEFIDKFEVTPAMINNIVEEGEKEGIERNDESLRNADYMLINQTKALIARDIFKRGAYYQIMNQDDKEIAKAIEILQDKESFAKRISNYSEQ